MVQSLFIYWRVAPVEQAAAEAAARQFQREAEAQVPGLAARLYRRDDAAKGHITLMETYSCAGGLSAAGLQRLVADSGAALGAWATGGRHVEVFEEAR